MTSLLEYTVSNRSVDIDTENTTAYIEEFNSAERKFQYKMGWTGPRGTGNYSGEEYIRYQNRILCEAYDNERIDFEKALIGYMFLRGR